MKTKNDVGGRVGSPGGPGCGQRPLSRLSLQAPGPPGLWRRCPLSGSGSGRAVRLSLPVHLLPLFQKEGPGSREV